MKKANKIKNKILKVKKIAACKKAADDLKPKPDPLCVKAAAGDPKKLEECTLRAVVKKALDPECLKNANCKIRSVEEC